MPPVIVDPAKVREFADAESFYTWLRDHHDSQSEVWIKIHKVGSGLASITQCVPVRLVFEEENSMREFLHRHFRIRK